MIGYAKNLEDSIVESLFAENFVSIDSDERTGTFYWNGLNNFRSISIGKLNGACRKSGRATPPQAQNNT